MENNELTAEEIEQTRLKIRTTNLYLETIFYGTGILAFVIYILKNIIMR